MTSKDDKPMRRSGPAFREIGEEGGLVVVPENNEVEVLNPVGAKVYSMLDGKHTIDDIVKAVTEEFEVSEAEAREDVRAFIEQLAGKDLLTSGAKG